MPKKRSLTHHALKLTILDSLSTHTAAKVHSSLVEEGVVVCYSSQAGALRSAIRKGKEEKVEMKLIIQEENLFPC